MKERSLNYENRYGESLLVKCARIWLKMEWLRNESFKIFRRNL